MSVHRKIPPPAKPPNGHSSWLAFAVSDGWAGDNGVSKLAQKELGELLARLKVAEEVCELLASSYLVLPGQLDRDLLNKWRELKEKP